MMPPTDVDHRRSPITLTSLVIGHVDCDEFRSVPDGLRALGEVAAVRTLADADRWLADREPVDLVVMVQHRPGEFSSIELDRLRQAAPLARVVLLLGSWCEGETRSGSPPGGTTRIYWHQWAARWGHQRERLAAGQCPTWGLPVTASEEERLLIAEPDNQRPVRSGTVWVVAQSIEMSDWLVAACRAGGWTASRGDGGPLPEGLSAILWEIPQQRDRAFLELQRMTAATGQATPIVGLADFLRSDDAARLRAVGATSLISKPILLEDLHWHLANPSG
jgi:hypothetical protein